MANMYTLTYINHRGVTFVLNEGTLRVAEAELHSYNWEIQGVEQPLGIRPERIVRDAMEYEVTFHVRGSSMSRRSFLDAFHTAFEVDIADQVPGTLRWSFTDSNNVQRDWEIGCYVTECSTFAETFDHTGNTVVFYCPYPMWHTVRTDEFFGTGDMTPAEYLDYAYDYLYDYQSTVYGAKTMTIDSAFPANFKLTIYGATKASAAADPTPADITNPMIWIAGQLYGINGTIEAGGNVVIDSKARTVTYTTAADRTYDWFDRRTKSTSVFQQIPAGEVAVAWNEDMYFKIESYPERSEPRWS